jgi:hypothetical protein
MNADAHPLAPALAMAVPLVIHDLRSCPPDRRAEVMATWLDADAGQLLAEHADELLFRGEPSATLFVALARALAALSFVPGGVAAFGQHWESAWEEEAR